MARGDIDAGICWITAGWSSSEVEGVEGQPVGRPVVQACAAAIWE